MNASDIMTVRVVTIAPDATVQQAAKLMLEREVSALPVVDGSNRLIGIISEGDLVRRAETGTERKPSWWLSFVSGADQLAHDFVKAHGTKVSDVMTTDVVVARPDSPLREVAGLLESHRIKRVPVVEEGLVIGVVSRANLLQALASARPRAAAPQPSDSDLRDTIVDRLSAQPWSHPSIVNPIVTDGMVDLWGMVLSPTERNAVRVLVEETPGVRGVNDHLAVRRIPSGV
ncbi:CBS domain-containing protein [Pseudorhodoplanes sp.]|uniref:CBS domain-containing protein n=1 Tax=Pseudorhodoplanes sp. TaxID=1934341 RepID=UPI003D13BB5F